MTAPVSLTDYRAERAAGLGGNGRTRCQPVAAEAGDDNPPLTLDEAGGFIGQLRDRVALLERRLARLERRTR